MNMIRLAMAWLLGALVGAVVAGGISLLAFAYPVRTEISNFPVDDGGNIRVTGSIETIVSMQSPGTQSATSSELLSSADGQGLYCFCSPSR